MIRMAALSRWLGFAVVIGLHAAAARDQIFDLEIRDGEDFEEREFSGLLPTPVFDLRADATLDSVETSRANPPDGTVRGELKRSGSLIIEELPGDGMFGRVDYDFGPGGGLEEVTLSTQLLVPSRGRLERLYGALVRLLGPPERLDRQLLYERPNPESLNFTWKQDGHRLLLLLKNDESYFSAMLTWYPGETNKTYGRVLARFHQDASADPTASLKAYLDRVKKLPAGDGPPVPEPAAADEAACFRQYHEANQVRFGRKWRLADKPQIAVLRESLARRYRPLGDKGACEHLLAIVQGKQPGMNDYEVRNGAEAYLASLDTTEAIPCLFEVLRPESGLLSRPAVDGLAARCKGDVLDQVVRMLEAGGNSADQAMSILSVIRDPTLQLAAERRVPALKSADAKKRARWAVGYAKGLPPPE